MRVDNFTVWAKKRKFVAAELEKGKDLFCLKFGLYN